MSCRPRTFRVLGVQQIALGNSSRSALATLWKNCLGASEVGHFRSESENVDEEILQIGRGLGVVEIDLMEPVDAEARPRIDTPALHHVGLWIDDLHAAAAWLIEAGVRLTRGGIRKGAGGHNVCFIHPKGNALFPLSGEGVLIELVQAPAAVISAFDQMAPGAHASALDFE